MEQLAVPPDVMRKRVEETLDLLGIAELRGRPLRDAVRRPAAAGRDRLGAHRAPAGAGARRADLGARPDRGRGGAGRDHPAGARPRHHGGGGRAPAGAGACSTPTGSCLRRRRAVAVAAARPTCMADSPGRAAGRRARPAGRLVAAAAVGPRRPPPARAAARPAGRPAPSPPVAGAPPRARAPVLRGPRRRGAGTATVVAVREVDLDLPRGEVVALMGRNGSGQVVAAVGAAGDRAPARRARWSSAASTRRSCRRTRPARLVGLVPADRRPTCSTWTTVDAECRAGRPRGRRGRRAPAAPLLDRLVPGIARRPPPARPVRGAAARAGAGRPAGRGPGRGAARRADPRPRLRGQGAARRDAPRAARAEGHAVVLATHDVEFVAAVADRVVVLADGEVVADGPHRGGARRLAGVRPAGGQGAGARSPG